MTIPLILIHGVGLDHHIWDPFCAEYKGQTYAYDLRGHGDAPHWHSDASLAQFSTDLLQIIAQNGWSRVNLCGFSMGAMIALHAAQELGSRLNRLILLASVYERNEEQRISVQKRLHHAQKNGPNSIISAALERWFPSDLPPRNKKYRDMVRKSLKANDPEQFLRNYALFASADRQLPALSAHVHCPCLVIAGGRDQNSTPQMGQNLANALSDAQYLLYEDATHMLPLHDCAKLAQDIDDFLHEDAR